MFMFDYPPGDFNLQRLTKGSNQSYNQNHQGATTEYSLQYTFSVVHIFRRTLLCAVAIYTNTVTEGT